MRTRLLYWILPLGLLTGCGSPGPVYHKPELSLPKSYSEGPWQVAKPGDGIPRGQWWSVYQDPTLDTLEEDALHDNFTLKAAMARVNQAKALVSGAEAAFMPIVSLAPTGARTRTSANRPYSVPNTQLPSTVQNDFIPSASVRWETDLSGRLSSTQEAAQANAEQAMADQEAVRLSVSTNLALTYFSLRAVDADLAWLEKLRGQQEAALSMIERRSQLGQASALDVVSIDAQLRSTRVQIESLKNQRQPLLNALATLTNKTPSEFKLAEGRLPETLHTIGPGIPSDLLQRRPDIASSERAVASANASIGIAESARYPSLTLSGSIGSESRVVASLLDAPSLVWAFGVSLSQVIFDGGRIESSVQAARAAHESAVASYRASVIGAINEVETALYATEALKKSWEEQVALAGTEQKQLKLVKQRHDLGQGTAYDVVFAEETLTSAERISTQIYAQRVLAEIYLFKALGGSWAPTGTTAH